MRNVFKRKKKKHNKMKKGLSVRKPTAIDMKDAEQLAFSAVTNGANIMSLSGRQHKQQKQQPQQYQEARQPSSQQESRRRRSFIQKQQKEKEEEILPEFPSELMFTTLSDELLFDVDASDDEEEQEGDTDEDPREQVQKQQQQQQQHRICLIPLDGRVISVEDHSRSSNFIKQSQHTTTEQQRDDEEKKEERPPQISQPATHQGPPESEELGSQKQRPGLTRQDSKTSWRTKPSMLTKQKALRNGLISNHLTDVTPEEFLDNFEESSEKFLSTAYMIAHPVIYYEYSNTLHTSLPEDVFALIEAQLSLLQEYTTVNDAIENIHTIVADGSRDTNDNNDNGNTKRSTSFSASSSLHIKNVAISSILSNITEKQLTFRHTFLRTFEASIAASNDFMKMSNMLQDVMEQHLWGSNNQSEENEEFIASVQQLVSILIQRFTNDAVYAIERAIMFIVNSIQDSNIPNQLFSHEWEDEYTHNQIMVSIVDTIEDYLVDMKTYLEDPYLYSKAIIACLRSAICFYVQCFINKANKLRNVLSSVKVRAYAFVPGGKTRALQKVLSTSFRSPKRAVCRMKYDIQVLQEYFERTTTTNGAMKNSIVVLQKAMEKELSVFDILMECMELAVATHTSSKSSSSSSSASNSSSSNNNLEELVFVVHKRTGGNVHVTQNFLSDLWLLFGGGNHHNQDDTNHSERRRHNHKVIERAISNMQSDLERMTLALREVDGRSGGDRQQQESSDTETNDENNDHYQLNIMLEHFYQHRQSLSSLGCGVGDTTTAMVQEARHIAKNIIHGKSPLKV